MLGYGRPAGDGSDGSLGPDDAENLHAPPNKGASELARK